jgi:hypothetical protein
VEGSVGEAAPLVLAGIDPTSEASARQQATARGIGTTLKILPPIRLADLPGLYRGAAAYLGAEPAANGQSLRWALSCGVPVAGLRGPQAEAILGAAAYLARPGDARRLGAACLTLLVEEQVAADLRQKGLQRAAAYRQRGAAEAWMAAFHRAAT